MADTSFPKNTELYCIQSSNSKLGLFVECWKSGDRFQHRIGCLIGQSKYPVLNSIEGDDTQIWPPSPAIQQVHQQEVESDPVILAVGMAGRNHFSMSMRITETAERCLLTIESACLVKQAAGANASGGDGGNSTEPFLGTTFEAATKLCPIDWANTPSELVFEVPTGATAAEPGAVEVLPVLKPGPTTTLATDSKRVQILPGDRTPNKPTQWCCTIELRH